MFSCLQLPSNHSFIGQYLPTERVVVFGGWGNGSGRQLQTSLLQHLNWGPLDHVSHGPPCIKLVSSCLSDPFTPPTDTTTLLVARYLLIKTLVARQLLTNTYIVTHIHTCNIYVYDTCTHIYTCTYTHTAPGSPAELSVNHTSSTTTLV